MTYQQRMAAYRQEAERLAAEDNTEKLRRAVDLLQNCRRIIIGGGAGLSAAGGMDFSSGDLLKRRFPGLAAMGYETLWQALWDPGRSEAQQWGMHAAQVLWSVCDHPALPVYRDLLRLVAGRDYFVLTTNFDEQFVKAGFDPARVFAPQSSVLYFQCARPCCDDIWPAEAAYRRIAAHTDPETYACRPEDIPRCPHCGGPVINNTRDYGVYPRPPEVFLPRMVMWNREAFEAYFAQAMEMDTVLLELGVGLNSPGLIRHPFQRMTQLHPNLHLIRMNRDLPSVPSGIRDRSVVIGGDLGAALAKMAEIAETACESPARLIK